MKVELKKSVANYLLHLITIIIAFKAEQTSCSGRLSQASSS